MSNLKVTSKITREYGGRPFDEAIAFFRQKLNIPTEHWDDLWKEQHAKGFMVAGAMKAELLTDLRIAMDKAISSGTTLKDFRKDFDKIVEKHGWIYKGGRNWRTKVIYDNSIYGRPVSADDRPGRNCAQALFSIPAWRLQKPKASSSCS